MIPDPSSSLPVDEIADEWRSLSKRVRYESVMWRAAGLEEPGTKGANSEGAKGAGDYVEEAEVDNMTRACD